MTDKEILAGLKLSYEKLYDIRENGCADHCSGQLENNMIKRLEIAKFAIEDLYSEFYKTLDKGLLRVKQLESDGNKIYIASDISRDYESDTYDLTCSETEYSWYEDQNFIHSEINYDIKYYVKVWITENDREQGFADEYYKNFDNLKDAIEELRTYFSEGNCSCVEIYDSNDVLKYSCDEESEDFYINDVKIKKVSDELLGKYVSSWVDHKKKPIEDDLLYCKNDDRFFTAVDNRSNNCFTENFDSENKVFDWLLDKFEIESGKVVDEVAL